MRPGTISISRKEPPCARAFRQYINSGAWQCSAGGAHEWFYMNDGTWRCRKCCEPRVFEYPDYVWNDRGGADMHYGARMGIDGLRGGLI